MLNIKLALVAGAVALLLPASTAFAQIGGDDLPSAARQAAHTEDDQMSGPATMRPAPSVSHKTHRRKKMPGHKTY